MNEVILRFLKPGLLTTVQDLGRNGHQAFGVPVGGVLDENSAKTANWLVGNTPESPVLEITLMGPQIEFDSDCQIALTGANLSPKINGEPARMYETISVLKNSRLTFGKLQNGCRTYLAVGGNWQIKKWLKSASTASQNSEILTPDSLIKKGSHIRISLSPKIEKRTAFEQRIPYPSIQTIQVLAGPEFEWFSRSEIAFFFGKNHKITPDSNRMGYRLNTQFTDYQQNKELISSAVIPGTIQITNLGQPVILMKDAQTTGGYPRFLNVISEDLDKLGQMKPGDEIRFEFTDFISRRKGG